MKVKVLSLKQPWAELLASGRKTIELRGWNTNYRGEFYIHASKNTSIEDCKRVNLNPDELTTGAIIGKCRITDVIKYETEEERKKDYDKHFAFEYKIPCYGFMIKDAERINPIKCNGKLNFFDCEI